MDNRNRDKMSKESTSSTSAGNVNRNTSQQSGNVKSDSEASFGQNIGRSEKPENEPSRRSGSSGSMGSSSGGSSSGNLGSSSDNVGSSKSSSGSSSSSSEGWQSSGGRRSNVGEQSDVEGSSSSSSKKSYGEGEH